jgi:Zn-dependent protease
MPRFSWKIGRIEGIDLYLHPTFLLLLLWVYVSQGGLFAAVLTAGVFGCVVLHELGHALMARRYGIRTEDITLYPIGGVARLERMPRSAGPELLIALAGPAVNFVIAGGLYLGLSLAGPRATNNLAGLFLTQLLNINLGLGLFNLLPVFPMDGGRVLRALLSGWMGRLKATEIAVQLGQTLAIVAMFMSIFYWEALFFFLALFVYSAGGRELMAVRYEEAQRTPAGEPFLSPPPPGYQWVTRGDGIWTLAPTRIRPQNDFGPWQ